MVESYLALPGEIAVKTPAAVHVPAFDAERVSDEQDLELPKVSETALVVARRRSSEREAFVRAWSALTARQQIFLRALQQTGFSTSRARVILNGALHLDSAKAVRHKLALSTSAVQRWSRQDENYKIVLAALKAEAAVQVTSRDDLLLRAHRAAEYAEDLQPILHQGADTGFSERDLGKMLAANEQLMKATKVLGGDDNRVQVAIGPALVIQVVQQDGSVKDVTPRGVIIDLPQPSCSP